MIHIPSITMEGDNVHIEGYGIYQLRTIKKDHRRWLPAQGAVNSNEVPTLIWNTVWSIRDLMGYNP